MVHYKKFIFAAKRYLEDEIVSKAQGSIKGAVLSFAAFTLGARGEKLFIAYKDNPIASAMGLIEGENVDDELLLQFLRGKIQNGMVTYPIPLIGNMDFSMQDVENFARLLRE